MEAIQSHVLILFVCMRSASGGMVAGGSPWEVCVNGGSTGVCEV